MMRKERKNNILRVLKKSILFWFEKLEFVEKMLKKIITG